MLKVLAKGAPNAHIFVVSQFSSPWRGPSHLSRSCSASTTAAARALCDALASSGQIIPKKLAYLESVIHGYESALAAACKQVAICRYDGGAFGRIVDRVEYVARDGNHFSIKGHAKAAAVAWAAMKRAGLVPRSG